MMTERDIKDLYSIIGVLCDKVEYLEERVKGLEREKRKILSIKNKVIKVDFTKE